MNANALWDAVEAGFASMIDLTGDFLTAMFSGSLAGLLPLFAIGIAISVLLVAVKIDFVNGLARPVTA